MKISNKIFNKIVLDKNVCYYCVKSIIMATIVVSTKTKETAEFILEFIEKIGEKGIILTDEKQEDFLFGQIVQANKTGKTISRDTIMKNLKATE